jgi:medium-chain acyl-[acyl-carrier-protein] hydrolase
LFCFPFSGSGAQAYRTWSSELPETIDICPVQLPGREARMSEPRHTSLADLVPRVVDALLPRMEPPFSLFGHSVGALIAFAVTRELRRRGLGQPVQLIVSGRNAPHLGVVYPLHHFADARLLDELRRLDPPRPEAWSNTDLVELMLPVVRADLTINDTYVHQLEEPLEMPIVAFCGSDDHVAPPASVQAWQKETRSVFRCHVLPGRHFFLHSSWPLFLGTLRRELDLVTRPPAGDADQ